MPNSIPVLCGSISLHPSKLGLVMHNAAYEALGLPFTYVAFGSESPLDVVSAMRSLGMRGLGVSMPYKIQIMQYLDKIDETAAKIGAVNTVVNDDGVLTGHNTDWIGVVRALQEKVSIAGTRSIVVGAGGAARAIVYGLVREKSQVTLYNRTLGKGQELVEAFGVRLGGNIAELDSVKDYDILINATSVGYNAEDESIIPPSLLEKGKVVLDAVFLPPYTKLYKEAISRGCNAVPGVRMLLHQARYQFELYTGKNPPIEVMEEALLDQMSRSSK
jgi:shikimate dehydrogenase